MSADKVRPAHYTQGSKFEVINVIERMGLSFSAGNALKYLARAGKKPGEDLAAELRKAEWYLERAIVHGTRDAVDYVKIQSLLWVPILNAWEITYQTERADALTAIFDLRFDLALAAVRREIADLPSNLAGRAVVDVDALLSLRPGDTAIALWTQVVSLEAEIGKHRRLVSEFRHRPDYRADVQRWARITGRLVSHRRRFADAATALERAL